MLTINPYLPRGNKYVTRQKPMSVMPTRDNCNCLSFKALPKFAKYHPFYPLWNFCINKTLKVSRRMILDIEPAIKDKIKNVVLQTADKQKLNCWDINPNNSKKYVLFLHGMSTNIRRHQKEYLAMNNNDYGVFALEYRGFGLNKKANISEEKLDLDVKAAFDYLSQKAENINLIGHSAGTAMATRAAAQNDKYNSLILVSPIDGIYSSGLGILAKKNIAFPSFVRFLIEKSPRIISPFDKAYTTSTEVPKINVPTYIIHSANDLAIPSAVAQNLAQKTKNLKALIILPEGGHKLEETKTQAILNILNGFSKD